MILEKLAVIRSTSTNPQKMKSFEFVVVAFLIPTYASVPLKDLRFS